MSVTGIPESVKFRLWGKAAGRCQYEDCNEPLFYDELTKAEFNSAYIAHIYADSKGGPRWDEILSPRLNKDISNLMLLCDRHHRLIDREQVAEHPAERLQEMKALHEQRVSVLTAITPDKQSHVILFGANIGQHHVPLSYREAAYAMRAHRYPAAGSPIELGLKNLAMADQEPGYWELQEKQLLQMFNRQVLPLKGNHRVEHFSVFGLAPMPLLVRLGTLLSDIFQADIYQRMREPAGWEWQAHTDKHCFELKEPTDYIHPPVLKISLSGQIADERIREAIDGPCTIWELTVNEPGNDFLRSRELLAEFRKICRHTYDQVKFKHPGHRLLHVFPAMPVSAALELGRTRMPKADMPMLLYDQNKVNNCFVPTIKII